MMYFIRTIATRLKQGYEVLYVDETSVSKWDRQVKTYMNPDDPLVFRLQPVRDKGFTIIGALRHSDMHFHWNIAKSSNSEDFRLFCSELMGYYHWGKGVIVLDNHSSHKGKTVDLLNQQGLEVLFLPPYS
jgi:hypothetical protein